MNYSDELRDLSEAARGGDTTKGARLLKLFSDLALSPENAHPELVRHVAHCIGLIINGNQDPREALCIKRKAHREKDSGKIKDRQELAREEYCKARASGCSHDKSMELAITNTPGMTESAMKHLYDNSNKTVLDAFIRFIKASK